ncbi:hypothetical protein ACI76O_02330 [Capnocytophaga cynodegmi]|uniref:hypothetical protein n=1 Tax=Capnocytophaga cynodegmi TaxID=28189 RepID=UPI003858B24B
MGANYYLPNYLSSDRVRAISSRQQPPQKYDVDFYLTIVPTIYVEEITPCLAPSMAIIDFCHQTRTEIDIDMYLINKR